MSYRKSRAIKTLSADESAVEASIAEYFSGSGNSRRRPKRHTNGKRKGGKRGSRKNKNHS